MHLAGPEENTLLLAAAAGLPAPLAQAWERIPRVDTPALSGAVTEAVARREVTWSSPPLPPERRAGFPTGWETTVGMLSAPITAGDTPVGALSVLTSRVPDAARRAFLTGLARTTSRQLLHVRRWPVAPAPWWQEPARPRAVQPVKLGTWAWDLATGQVDVDQVAEEVLRGAGLPPERWAGQVDGWLSCVHPDDRPAVEVEAKRALDTHQLSALEYRVVGEDGRISWMEERWRGEYDTAGNLTRMTGTVVDITARRSQHEWLAGLLELHPEPIEVLDDGNRVAWANRASRGMAAEKGAEIVGAVPWEAVPALRGHGLPQLVDRARTAPGSVALLEMELPADEHGAAAYYQVRAVEVGGHVAVQRADVTEHRRAERAAAERTQRVADLNAALAKALETADVAAAVTEHVLPLFGATGLVLHDQTGPGPRVVGAVGYPKEFLDELNRLEHSARPPVEITAVSEPQYVSSPEEFARRWPRLESLARLGRKHAWAVLPLLVGERSVGSCVLSWADPRPFRAEERTLLETLATFIAQALSNARLYEQTRARAERLQRELLPGELPGLVGVTAAARYRAAAGQDVGGDWYDTVPLPGGRVLAVIGDVLGHGLEQAIVMGIIRHAVLVMATLDMPAEDIMAHLGDVAARLEHRTPDAPSYATALIVLYDPTAGTCHIASAGHPPPLVLRPGGEGPPQALDVPPGPPLGVTDDASGVPPTVTRVDVEPGSVLILYTNGLLGADATQPGPLAEAVSAYAATHPGTHEEAPGAAWLEGLCQAVVTGLPAPSDRRDDAALLVLSAGRVPAGRIAVWDLPCAAESARKARALVTDRLADWALTSLVDSLRLIVSELIGNTVRHASGLPGGSAQDDHSDQNAGTSQDDQSHPRGTVRLRLLHLETGVVCEVYDGSEATPRVRHPALTDEFGRGLQLVALSSDGWGARYTEGGKCVWARLDIAPVATAP
ncbi:SpoIIE family protein phosphatase [Streptomyces sp. NPDC001663]|uniref:SpoIIE family protein phosphatase n=1 Tax=Streptomyces sp. NPDC001663 TaxID=3364597 RepID=UPI0036C5886B